MAPNKERSAARTAADYEGVARYEVPAVAAGDTTSPAARATAALANV